VIGQTVSHYKILDRLGEGGMGVVYRAEDTRLDRAVAVKFLPEELAEDPAALERFRREARAASALNHAHISAIYDIGEHQGRPFLVLELLKGSSLKRELQERPLPPERVLELGSQLADALDAAHEAGIVHRDIKPGNIFVTTRGDAKILDFGLAKMRGDREARVSTTLDSAETELAPRDLTAPGTAMGTIAYMSPEQVRGEELDHRTDLFSLGVVLYEMATGKQPFGGQTSGIVFDHILNKAPTAPVKLNPDLPEGLEAILDKALEKDRGLRYQHASDLRADLKRLLRDTSTSISAVRPVQQPRRGRRAALPWIAAVVAIVVATALTWRISWDRAPEAPTAPMKITPFTAEGGWKDSPKFSPDGDKVAYMWNGPSRDNWDIYIKALGIGTKPLRLTEHPATEVSPVWSPDGRQIAFARDLEEGPALFLVPSLGGQEQKLADIGMQSYYPGQNLPVGLSWSPHREWPVFAERASERDPFRIVGLSPETREKQILTSPPHGSGGDFYPEFSPDGAQFAFVRLGAALHDVPSRQDAQGRAIRWRAPAGDRNGRWSGLRHHTRPADGASADEQPRRKRHLENARARHRGPRSDAGEADCLECPRRKPILLSRRQEDRLPVVPHRDGQHLALQQRRLRSGEAHTLRQPHRNAPLVSRRPLDRLRLPRVRELGPPRR
jgi:serine/threonine protein kinase